MELDLTTHTKREHIAIDIGAELCADYDEMAPVMRAVARVLKLNETACIGANRVGNRTKTWDFFHNRHFCGFLFL